MFNITLIYIYFGQEIKTTNLCKKKKNSIPSFLSKTGGLRSSWFKSVPYFSLWYFPLKQKCSTVIFKIKSHLSKLKILVHWNIKNKVTLFKRNREEVFSKANLCLLAYKHNFTWFINSLPNSALLRQQLAKLIKYTFLALRQTPTF